MISKCKPLNGLSNVNSCSLLQPVIPIRHSRYKKKSFFSKIDKKYTAKDEGLETMVPNKKDDKESQKDKARTSTMTGEKPTKIDTKPEVNYK